MTRFGHLSSLGVLVLTSALVAGLQVGPVSASRLAESTGGAVEQEQSAEPSSEQIAELVARAAALQEQLQAVLDELQALLGDSDRPAGGSGEPFRIGDGIRAPMKVLDVAPVYPPEAREARVQGVVILEATLTPDGRGERRGGAAFRRAGFSTRRRSPRSGSGGTSPRWWMASPFPSC